MAIGFSTVVPGDSVGNRRLTVTDVTLDATTYTTGGFPFTAQQFGLGSVAYGDVAIKTVPASAVTGAFLDCTNPLAPKVKCLASGTAEVANAQALTGMVVEVTAVGSL